MNGSALKIKVKNLDEGIRKLVLKGVIDGHTGGTFEKAINDTIDDEVKLIILDFYEVTYMSSSGVGVMISSHSKMEEESNGEGRIVILKASGSVQDVFRILEIKEMFFFSEEEEAAVNWLKN